MSCQKGCSSFFCNEDESVASWRRDKGMWGLVLVLAGFRRTVPRVPARRYLYYGRTRLAAVRVHASGYPGVAGCGFFDKTYQSYWYLRCRLRLMNALRKKNDPRNQTNRLMVLPFYLACLSYQHPSDRYTQQWFQG